MNSATINGKKFEVPGSWNQLTQVQAQNILRLFLRPFTEEQLRISVLLILFNVKGSLPLKWIFFRKLKRAHVHDLFPLTDFILKDIDLCRNYYPVIIAGGKKLFGPSSHLSNSSFIEYIEADNAFVAWMRTKEEKYKDRVVAILYRPAKPWIKKVIERLLGQEYSSDKREKFSQDAVEENLKLISPLDADIKSAIFDYFNACRNFIIDHPSHSFIYEKVEQGENKFDPNGWFKVLGDVAGKEFGDFDKTAYVNVYTVLMRLNLLIQRSKELIAKYEKK